MIALLTVDKAQAQIATNLREWRVAAGLTQAGLAKRSGVSIATLRKFEQKGLISIESFLRITMVLDLLEEIVAATEQIKPTYSSIEDVLSDVQISEASPKKTRKRGWRT